MIVVDMDKARDVWRNRLRAERAPRLGALDVEFARAMEAGDVSRQREIAAQKQALRDVPGAPAISAASSPAELKALTLDLLTQP